MRAAGGARPVALATEADGPVLPEEVERAAGAAGVGRVASVIGRYFAMDRDKRWERVQLAYDALTLGQGLQADSAQAAIAQAYERGENDEFVKPTVIGSPDRGRVRTGDAVISFNFRTDRARQLTEAFVSHDFAAFARASFPVVHFVTMTRYREDFPCPIAFPPQSMKGALPQVVSTAGGNAEIVVDGETGYVVPKGDADALAAALRRYLEDPAKAVAHGEAGFARSMQMFTDEHLGPEVEAVVRGLLTPAAAEA